MVVDRKPYFPVLETECRCTFSFRPVPESGPIHLYHIADVHNRDEPALRAGRFFGDQLDLLVLNGDVPDSSESFEKFSTIFTLGSDLTRGEIPIVFSRGNHDLRGFVAESMTDYVPSDRGRTYYTFRLGRIWGMVLDCGEDKSDDHAEYGGTTCFHAFRERETEWIRQVAEKAEREYEAPGVEYKLVICHMPFAWQNTPPFDIESELYAEWCRILRTTVHPDLMLHGHVHDAYVVRPGEERDTLGTPCPYLVGAIPGMGRKGGEGTYTGMGLLLEGREAQVLFTNEHGEVVGSDRIELAPEPGADDRREP